MRSLIWISCLIPAVMITGCAGQAKPVELTSEVSQSCAVMAGVSLLKNELTINAGEKPTPGYSVELVTQTRDRKGLKVEYQLGQPATGAILPQMLTSPCRRILLPEDWERLTVVNKDSDQQWVFEQP